jgi:hypothetical protein
MDLMEKNKNGISKYDIQKVANDLTIGITDEQINEVWKEYDEVVADFPNENWTAIVEDLIYKL